MNSSYAIFEAEFRTSFRSAIQSFKKRFASTFFISFLGIIFSFACSIFKLFKNSEFIIFPSPVYASFIILYFSTGTMALAFSDLIFSSIEALEDLMLGISDG